MVGVSIQQYKVVQEWVQPKPTTGRMPSSFKNHIEKYLASWGIDEYHAKVLQQEGLRSAGDYQRMKTGGMV